MERKYSKRKKGKTRPIGTFLVAVYILGQFTFFTNPIIQFLFGKGGGGGLFALKQWISSSLKHDTVPRVNNLYCFYVKIPPPPNHQPKKPYCIIGW